MIVSGIDSSLVARPLLLAADGSVIVSASNLTTTGGKFRVDANGDVYVTAADLTTTGGKIKIDSSGRVTVIQDEPSYTNPIGGAARNSNTNIAAGTSMQVIATVTAGERWILDCIAVYYSGTVAGVTMYPLIIENSTNHALATVKPPVSGVFYSYFPDVVCEAGWQIAGQILGGTAGDDFIGDAFYRRIK